MEQWNDIDISSGYFNGTESEKIYGNLKYIGERFSQLGWGNVEILDCSMSNEFDIYLIEKFNNTEKNIDNLHAFAPYRDKYYIKRFVWSYETDLDKYLGTGIRRWVNWLNEAKRYCDGVFESVTLQDINGEIITDIEGNQILVYKEW